jgi:hypothetical protein
LAFFFAFARSRAHLRGLKFFISLERCSWDGLASSMLSVGLIYGLETIDDHWIGLTI